MYVVKISNRFRIGSFQNHCMSREEACLPARWSSADKVACHVTLTDEVKKWASDGSRTLPQKLLQLRYQVPVYYFLLSAAARVFWGFFECDLLTWCIHSLWIQSENDVSTGHSVPEIWLPGSTWVLFQNISGKDRPWGISSRPWGAHNKPPTLIITPLNVCADLPQHNSLVGVWMCLVCVTVCHGSSQFVLAQTPH